MIRAELTLPRLFSEGAAQLTVQLELAPSSLTALVGASGSGKTTLLRLLAGLETPQPGRIVVDDQVWTDTARQVNLRPQQRSVGYIFQDAALFPNLSVRENIRFVAPKEALTLADELLEATGLQPFAHLRPVRLSGGQRQRVALARALVRRPKLLLLDEPFAALDAGAAKQLRTLLGELHRAWGTTTLLVSHHHADIELLADRVITLAQGQIVRDQPTPPIAVPADSAEQINHVWFDEVQRQWVVETDTLQLRSVNPRWEQLQPGTWLKLSAQSWEQV